jgi:hypothetical protein
MIYKILYIYIKREMSEVTLKRKTGAKYNNNSVGKGFSLNGTHRSQGWVGQDTLSRSFPKTLMKGNVVKGHGGCCGKYPQPGIVVSAVTSLNDPTVVKSSVLDTQGMIRTKYRWIWRPKPFSNTKQDAWRTTLNQSEYITNLSVSVVNKIDISYSTVTESTPYLICCDTLPKNARPRPTINPQHVQTRTPGNYTKTNMSRPEKNNPIMGILGGNYVNYVMPQSTYVAYLDSGCTRNTYDISLNIVRPNCTKIAEIQNTLRTPLISGTRSFGT